MALLNLNNFPGKMISGVGDETLDFISRESNDRFLVELDPDFLNEIDTYEMNIGDSILTHEEQVELERIEKESIPFNTQKETDSHVNRFRTFLVERKLSENFETASRKILNDYLCLFYCKIRKAYGSVYVPQSLICIRASIQRHLSRFTDANIIKDHAFARSNKILKAMIGEKWKSSHSKLH